ncbi:MAG: hypothetical protein QXO40_00060 [Candidatus Aenigmatarchaeota archaeon]
MATENGKIRQYECPFLKDYCSLKCRFLTQFEDGSNECLIGYFLDVVTDLLEKVSEERFRE